MVIKMLINEMSHIKCSKCNKQLTHVDGKEDNEEYDDEDIEHDTFFSLSRKNCVFNVVNVEDGEGIEIDEQASNEKMCMYLCEECFNDLLNGVNNVGSIFDMPTDKFPFKQRIY